ncbi:MAG: hypothetical protein HY420_04570 [Candidatus Kerfeldbacteria bacterium]|nr:hypothetical protein [Candidatus Kerfeldbacteria bacterium]
MSVRAILDQQMVQAHAQETRHRYGRRGENEETLYNYHGITIYPASEGAHISLGLHVEAAQLNPIIPASFFKGFTAEIFVRSVYLRQEGRYEHGKSIAIVRESSMGHPGGRDAGYWLYLESMDPCGLEDLKQLHELILAGRIYPKVPFNVPQVSPHPQPIRTVRNVLTSLFRGFGSARDRRR